MARSDTSARLARVFTSAKHTRSRPGAQGRVVGDRHPDRLERGPAPVELDAPRRRDELARAGELVFGAWCAARGNVGRSRGEFALLEARLPQQRRPWASRVDRR